MNEMNVGAGVASVLAELGLFPPSQSSLNLQDGCPFYFHTEAECFSAAGRAKQLTDKRLDVVTGEGQDVASSEGPRSPPPDEGMLAFVCTLCGTR